MTSEPLGLLPELLLLVGAVVTLLSGSWLPRHRQWVARLVAAAATLASLATGAVALAGPPRVVLDGFAVDTATGVARLVVTSATLLLLCLSVPATTGSPRETEACTLLLLAALGAVAMAGSTDLLVLVMAFLLASIPLYALAAFAKDAPGTEAALKYYLLGAFLGVVLLVGVTLLFGVGGTTAYDRLGEGLADAPRAAVVLGVVGLLVGLLFKAGGVPSHFWVPDVVAGAPAFVGAVVTTVPKVGALVAAYRVLDTAVPESVVDWPLLVAVVAAASMTLGNLAAFRQDDVRRLLGYSTVSQVGYLLMAVAAAGRSELALPALLYYLAAYAVTNLAAFGVVVALPQARQLSDFSGLARRHRWLALVLVVALLGLVGTPPTSGFVGKLTVFSAAADAGLVWLVVVAAVNTVASLFYYLRWVAPVFLADPGAMPAPAGRTAVTGTGAAAVASLVLGLAGGPALALAQGPLLP